MKHNQINVMLFALIYPHLMLGPYLSIIQMISDKNKILGGLEYAINKHVIR